MPSPKPEKNDIAIAHKAICIAPGLSSADKAVAAAILDHYNKKTGQCDPSNERLATLLGLDQTTVRRGTAALSGVHGLFSKKSHGGKSCRASYTPIWSAFRQIVCDWDRRMMGVADPESGDEYRAEMPGSDEDRTGQNCPPNRAELPVKQGRNALQTYYRNPSYEPISPEVPSECDAAEPQTPSLRKAVKGLLKRESGAAHPPNYEARERAATKGSTHEQAAWSSAEYRLDAAIARAPVEWRTAMNVLLDQAGRDDAIRAEVKRRGEGIAYIDTRMRLARLEAGRSENVH